MSKPQLPIPPGALKAASATEIARVWIADGSQHVTLATELWSDPAAWGLVLVDLARHVARAYEQTQGVGSQEALDRIREAMAAEWSSPADDLSGNVLDS